MYTFRFMAGVYARCQNAMEKLKKINCFVFNRFCDKSD